MALIGNILVVDDDDDLREALAEQLLAADDLEVFEAASGKEALEKVESSLVDLIILDLGLPDIGGYDLCRMFRQRGIKCPIIMLTGQHADADTIRGLDAGANDYVTKPFKFAVFLARIRAQMRQHEQSEAAMLMVGPYQFQPANKMLTDSSGSRIRLTDKEAGILKHLSRAGNRAVSRDVLLREVWGYNAGVTTHTLETHVYRLRQKLRDASQAPLIVTENGGYRLVG